MRFCYEVNQYNQSIHPIQSWTQMDVKTDAKLAKALWRVHMHDLLSGPNAIGAYMTFDLGSALEPGTPVHVNVDSAVRNGPFLCEK